MTGVEVLVAFGIAVGLVGVVVPVVPGALLVWAAILVWGIDVGTATGWGVVAAATGLIAGGQVVKYTIPGKQLRASGVPNRSLVIGGLVAIVGFFVVPVVGLFIGFVLGVYVSEYPAGRRSNGLAFDEGRPPRRWCLDARRAHVRPAGHGGVDHRGDRHLTTAFAVAQQSRVALEVEGAAGQGHQPVAQSRRYGAARRRLVQSSGPNVSTTLPTL